MARENSILLEAYNRLLTFFSFLVTKRVTSSA